MLYSFLRSKKGYTFVSAEVAYIPQTMTAIDDEEAQAKMEKLIDMLEERFEEQQSRLDRLEAKIDELSDMSKMNSNFTVIQKVDKNLILSQRKSLCFSGKRSKTKKRILSKYKYQKCIYIEQHNKHRKLRISRMCKFNEYIGRCK